MFNHHCIINGCHNSTVAYIYKCHRGSTLLTSKIFNIISIIDINILGEDQSGCWRSRRSEMSILCSPPWVWHTQLYPNSYGWVSGCPLPSWWTLEDDNSVVAHDLLLCSFLMSKPILCDVRLSEQSWKVRYGKPVGFFWCIYVLKNLVNRVSTQNCLV